MAREISAGNIRSCWTTLRQMFSPVCVAVVALILSAYVRGQENADSDNPPARVARISALKGEVSFLRAGVDQWSQAALNFPATTGDRVYTDKGARAELEVGPYTARMWERTDLTIANLNDQVMQLGVDEGSLRVTVRQLSPGETAEIDTPNGALTLLDPGKYRIDVDPGGDHTLVTVISGRLEMTGGGISQTVENGQAVRLLGQDAIDVEPVPMPPPDAFDAWSEERDLRVTSARSAEYVNPSTPGFDDLDQYGQWSDVVDYGPVWFPTVAVGWVPYRFGHWVWIDPWGWTWVEDEPWGFCPFHFGRWVLVGATWGWLPGPFSAVPVYAPAFVGFLGGPGFSIGVGVGLVAWFPLGPGEPFFPWYHYGRNYLNLVNITNIRNVTRITSITNITDIRNVHYSYRTVAATAVPQKVFSGGQPVARQIVRISPEQLARAQVIPHPSANPTRRAALPGRPISAPPVRPQPRFARTATPIARSGAPRSNAGTIARSAPARTTPAPLPRTEPQRLITRMPPARPIVPFVQRQHAMLQHPGRPLEPAQVEELRMGRPVTPMRDREFPPHPIPVPLPRPARPPHLR
jgi:hypothetical protein